MPTIIELTAQIVSAHAANTQLTSEQLTEEINKVFASLKALETGVPVDAVVTGQITPLTVKQAFKKDEVLCMICGKGFKMLKRHLNQVHGLKPSQYRKQFNIPTSQSLTAKSYSESRKQMAIENNLGDGLVKARAKRAAGKKIESLPVKPTKTPTTKAKTPVLKTRETATVPAETKKVVVAKPATKSSAKKK